MSVETMSFPFMSQQTSGRRELDPNATLVLATEGPEVRINILTVIAL